MCIYIYIIYMYTCIFIYIYIFDNVAWCGLGTGPISSRQPHFGHYPSLALRVTVGSVANPVSARQRPIDFAVSARIMGGLFSKSLSVDALSNEPYNQARILNPICPQATLQKIQWSCSATLIIDRTNLYIYIYKRTHAIANRWFDTCFTTILHWLRTMVCSFKKIRLWTISAVINDSPGAHVWGPLGGSETAGGCRSQRDGCQASGWRIDASAGDGWWVLGGEIIRYQMGQ